MEEQKTWAEYSAREQRTLRQTNPDLVLRMRGLASQSVPEIGITQETITPPNNPYRQLNTDIVDAEFTEQPEDQAGTFNQRFANETDSETAVINIPGEQPRGPGIFGRIKGVAAAVTGNTHPEAVKSHADNLSSGGHRKAAITRSSATVTRSEGIQSTIKLYDEDPSIKTAIDRRTDDFHSLPLKTQLQMVEQAQHLIKEHLSLASAREKEAMRLAKDLTRFEGDVNTAEKMAELAPRLQESLPQMRKFVGDYKEYANQYGELVEVKAKLVRNINFEKWRTAGSWVHGHIAGLVGGVIAGALDIPAMTASILEEPMEKMPTQFYGIVVGLIGYIAIAKTHPELLSDFQDIHTPIGVPIPRHLIGLATAATGGAVLATFAKKTELVENVKKLTHFVVIDTAIVGGGELISELVIAGKKIVESVKR